MDWICFGCRGNNGQPYRHMGKLGGVFAGLRTATERGRSRHPINTPDDVHPNQDVREAIGVDARAKRRRDSSAPRRTPPTQRGFRKRRGVSYESRNYSLTVLQAREARPREWTVDVRSLQFEFISRRFPMAYVDGFVVPVPKKKLKAYLTMAKWGKRVWMKHGALDYKECVGDDLKV